MKELESHYDLLADKYSSIHPLRYALVDFIATKILSKEIIKPFGKIVDFGCGSGELLNELSGKIPFPDLLTGVDLSSSMVKKAKGKGLNVIHSNFENVFFEKGTVSVGIFQESIHHADFNYLGPNLNRVMCTDGQLIVFYQCDWAVEPKTEAMNKFEDYARRRRTGPERIINALSLYGWHLNYDQIVEDVTSINFNFLADALEYNALSYWVSFTKDQKIQCIEAIKELVDEEDLVLKRKVKAMVFTRRTFD